VKKAKSGKAKVVKSDTLFQGRVFTLKRDQVIEPSGVMATREIIVHPGSVVVLPVLDDGRLVLIRQYRHAAGQYLWELVAGHKEPGESVATGVHRELAEETGYRAKKWRPLVEYYASPGFLGESMKVFLAEGLEPGEAQPEEDEQIELRLVKLSEVLKRIEKGAILDGKTLSSVLLYARIKAGRHKK